MDYQDYIKPGLIVLVPVLCFIGKMLKSSPKINNSKIPLLLGGIGILLCTLWVVATTPLHNVQEIAMGIFVAVTQGILVAGTSVYCHQLKKQKEKGR